MSLKADDADVLTAFAEGLTEGDQALLYVSYLKGASATEEGVDYIFDKIGSLGGRNKLKVSKVFVRNAQASHDQLTERLSAAYLVNHSNDLGKIYKAYLQREQVYTDHIRQILLSFSKLHQLENLGSGFEAYVCSGHVRPEDVLTTIKQFEILSKYKVYKAYQSNSQADFSPLLPLVQNSDGLDEDHKAHLYAAYLCNENTELELVHQIFEKVQNFSKGIRFWTTGNKNVVYQAYIGNSYAAPEQIQAILEYT